MNDSTGDAPTEAEPLLYYRTREDIEAYAGKPAEVKLAWLEAQMEFFFSSMTEQAKRARDQLLRNGPIAWGQEPDTLP